MEVGLVILAESRTVARYLQHVRKLCPWALNEYETMSDAVGWVQGLGLREQLAPRGGGVAGQGLAFLAPPGMFAQVTHSRRPHHHRARMDRSSAICRLIILSILALIGHEKVLR